MSTELPPNSEPIQIQAGQKALLRRAGDWVDILITAIRWWKTGFLKITFVTEHGTFETTRVVDQQDIRPAPEASEIIGAGKPGGPRRQAS